MSVSSLYGTRTVSLFGMNIPIKRQLATKGGLSSRLIGMNVRINRCYAASNVVLEKRKNKTKGSMLLKFFRRKGSTILLYTISEVVVRLHSLILTRGRQTKTLYGNRNTSHIFKERTIEVLRGVVNRSQLTILRNMIDTLGTRISRRNTLITMRMVRRDSRTIGILTTYNSNNNYGNAQLLVGVKISLYNALKQRNYFRVRTKRKDERNNILYDRRATRQTMRKDRHILNRLQRRKDMIRNSSLKVGVTLLVRIVRPNRNLFVLKVGKTMISLTTVIQINMRIVRTTRYDTRIPRTNRVMKTRKSLVINTITIRINNLSRVPMVLPVFRDSQTLGTRLFRPINTSSMKRVTKSLLVRRKRVVGVTITMDRYFFSAIPLISLLLRIKRIILSMIIRKGSRTKLTMFRRLNNKRVRGSIQRLYVRRRRVRTLIMVILQKIVGFGVRVRFFTRSLPSVRLLNDGLIYNLKFRSTRNSTLIKDDYSKANDEEDDHEKETTATLRSARYRKDSRDTTCNTSTSFSFFRGVFSSLVCKVKQKGSPYFRGLHSTHALPADNFSLLEDVSYPF